MKIAITIYPDDFAEADRIIHQLRGVRGLELDGYMGKAAVEKNFDKPRAAFAGDGPGGDSQSDEESGELHSAFGIAKPAPIIRGNVSPGEPSIGKIGSNTKDDILRQLREGMGQPSAKYAEHLKLLWKRNEVKFDGEEYYL